MVVRFHNPIYHIILGDNMPKQLKIAELFEKYSSNIISLEILQPLIDNLGVSVNSIRKLGVGINPLTGGYVFPEWDDKGNIIGLSQRFSDDTKIMVPGSKRGLTYQLNSKFTGVHYVSGAHYCS